MPDGHHHGEQAAHRGTDHGRPLRCNGMDQSENVLQVDCRLIVLRVRISRGESSAAYIRNDNPEAVLQMGSEIFEVAAVARQPVQAEHCCGRRLRAWVNSRIELESVVAYQKIVCVGWSQGLR